MHKARRRPAKVPRSHNPRADPAAAPVPLLGHVHVFGATVNDLLLAAVTACLRERLLARGHQIAGMVLRTSESVGSEGVRSSGLTGLTASPISGQHGSGVSWSRGEAGHVRPEGGASR